MNSKQTLNAHHYKKTTVCCPFGKSNNLLWESYGTQILFVDRMWKF